MANGSVDIDMRIRTDDGVLVAGRLLVGNADIIRAPDLNLNYIKSFQVSPYGRTPVGSVDSARIVIMNGSLGSINSIGSSNYVSLRSWGLDSYSAAGTANIGTLHGSIRAAFTAIGY